MELKEKKEMLKNVRRNLRLKRTKIQDVIKDTGLPQKWVYDTANSTHGMPSKFDRIILLHNYFYGDDQ